MTTSEKQEPCPPAFNTAFDALFSPEGRALESNPGAECKKCNHCGKWHLYASAWHPDSPK